MRSPWMYRAGALMLLFAGGLAIWIDAGYSYDWIAKNIGTSHEISMGLAFILAVLASSFGALVTNPQSWLLVFSHTRELAGIYNEYERLLTVMGYGLTALFLFAIFMAVYVINLVSNHAKTGNWFGAILICFASDAAFMLAMPVWFMSKAARRKAEELDAAFSGGHSQARTVNAKARGGRFN